MKKKSKRKRVSAAVVRKKKPVRPAPKTMRRTRAITRIRNKVSPLNTGPLVLPDLQTSVGLISRVLIGEPSFKNSVHDWPEQRRCMTALAALLYNRVNRIPTKYTQQEIANVTTADSREILAAPRQFDGFGKDPQTKLYTVTTDYEQRVDARVTLANTGAPGEIYATISHALALAKQLSDGSFDGAADPFINVTSVGGEKTTGRSYYMRTQGSGSPTSQARAIPAANGGNLAGNTFFTMLAKA